MSKELIDKVEKVFKDSTHCGWGAILEELKQALSDKDKEIENNLGLFTHMQQISQSHLDKLDKIEEVVHNNKNIYTQKDSIIQILKSAAVPTEQRTNEL